ncbi:MAG TPA: ABC transporter permease [Anaerolineales bacterium]|nr:ABC transporter permease [Anaerolineales bacterium]
MHPADLVRLVLENLGRRKARVALTAIGVVIGTAAVVVLVSLGIGLQRNATEQLGGISDLTIIWVYPTYGEVFYEGGGGGGPVMVAPAGPGSQTPEQNLLTPEALEQLAALPGVRGVFPRDYLQGGATMQFGRLENYPGIMGIDPDELASLDLPVQEGELDLARGTTVMGYYVTQGFYDPRLRPGQEPPPPPELIGETVKLTLIKYSAEGVESRKVVQLRVVGTIAETRGEPDYTAYLRLDDLEAMNQWLTGQRPNRNRDGYPMAIVKAEDSRQVIELADAITALGYQADTPMSFIQGINSFFVVLQVVFGGVGAIALLVAAIGIANTMTMSILERTREIGLMKAVGATNGSVLAVFLGEAAGIGFVGGLGGILVGWAAGQAINVLALAYLAGQAAETGSLPPSIAVFTPGWLMPSTLVFATLIGLVSGLYPALRAATLVPVTALKYE